MRFPCCDAPGPRHYGRTYGGSAVATRCSSYRLTPKREPSVAVVMGPAAVAEEVVGMGLADMNWRQREGESRCCQLRQWEPCLWQSPNPNSNLELKPKLKKAPVTPDSKNSGTRLKDRLANNVGGARLPTLSRWKSTAIE